MLIRLEALELAAQAETQDATANRSPLSVIHVAPDGAVTATDGHQLLRLRANVAEPGLFDALLPAVERSYEGDVLIDAGDARDFRAACKKAMKRGGTQAAQLSQVHVVVAETEDGLTLATQDGTVERRFTIKPPDEDLTYPNVERVIPRNADRQIIVSVDLMLKLLRTLKKLRVKGVTLGLSADPNAAIAIKASSIFGELDGALMPMRSTEDKDEARPSVEHIDTTTGEVTESRAH